MTDALNCGIRSTVRSRKARPKSEMAMIPTLYLVLPVILIVVLGELLIGVKEPVTVGRDPG